MTVVVSELIIKATVGGDNAKTSASVRKKTTESRQKIIQECVDEVLRIIEKKDER